MSKKTSKPDKVFLLNATDSDVWIRDGKKKQKLPRVTPVTLLSSPSREDVVTLDVGDVNDDKFAASVEFYSGVQNLGILEGLPPEMAGVLYLVDPETIVEFPWRVDFVAPAIWGIRFKKAKKGKKKGKRERMFSVLIGVTRTPWAVSDEDTPVLKFVEDSCCDSGEGCCACEADANSKNNCEGDGSCNDGFGCCGGACTD